MKLYRRFVQFLGNDFENQKYRLYAWKLKEGFQRLKWVLGDIQGLKYLFFDVIIIIEF